MFAMNLVDVSDYNTSYGFLLCGNDNVSEKTIQDKIYEITGKLGEANKEWVIEDVIKNIPLEWNVQLQESNSKIRI